MRLPLKITLVCYLEDHFNTQSRSVKRSLTHIHTYIRLESNRNASLSVFMDIVKLFLLMSHFRSNEDIVAEKSETEISRNLCNLSMNTVQKLADFKALLWFLGNTNISIESWKMASLRTWNTEFQSQIPCVEMFVPTLTGGSSVKQSICCLVLSFGSQGLGIHKDEELLGNLSVFKCFWLDFYWC